MPTSRITISHIINVLKTAGHHNKVPLGRWGICNNRNSGLVADYSNEDHCGSCGDYINKKKNNEYIKKDTEKMLHIEYECIVTNTPN